MGARQSRRVQQRDALRLAVDMSLSEAPLPVGWEQSVTPKGQTYFIDHVNKTTTFFDPRYVCSHMALLRTNCNAAEEGDPARSW